MEDELRHSYDAFCAKHEIGLDVQVELLLEFILEHKPEEFKLWFKELKSSLDNNAPEFVSPAKIEAEAFFEHDLLYAQTELLQLISSTECESGLEAKIVDTEYFTALQSILDGGVTLECEHNSILGGWYCDAVNGTVLIFIRNGDEQGGPYVDAVFLYVPSKLQEGFKNISLPPQYIIPGEYKFSDDITLHLVIA